MTFKQSQNKQNIEQNGNSIPVSLLSLLCPFENEQTPLLDAHALMNQQPYTKCVELQCQINGVLF